jgi:hypothetical protein
VFKNKVLRGLFGPKREKVAGIWRNLNNEELRNLYASPNFVNVIQSRFRWTGHVASLGEMRNAYKFLFREAERERACVRPRHR